MKLTIGATGRADVDEVWDRYIHPQRWSEWSPQISSVDTSDDTIRAGTTGTVHGPCGVGVDFEITEVDQQKRCWSWRVKLTFVTLELVHGVSAVADGAVADGAVGSDGSGAAVSSDNAGTRTTLTISGPAPIVIGYLPLARIALGRLVR